jgi:hypothetical protein
MRTILDRDLRWWEVYATTGDFGSANPAKVAFRCTSDAWQRPRVFLFPGDKSDAEKAVAQASDGELVQMLDAAQNVG